MIREFTSLLNSVVFKPWGALALACKMGPVILQLQGGRVHDNISLFALEFG